MSKTESKMAMRTMILFIFVFFRGKITMIQFHYNNEMYGKQGQTEHSLTAPTSLLSSPMPKATVATTFQKQKNASQ